MGDAYEPKQFSSYLKYLLCAVMIAFHHSNSVICTLDFYLQFHVTYSISAENDKKGNLSKNSKNGEKEVKAQS